MRGPRRWKIVNHPSERAGRGRCFCAGGRPPHLVRAGVAHLALTLGEGRFRVYVLGTSGERVREVPCRMHKGRLRFDADMAADFANATFLYEIVRAPL